MAVASPHIPAPNTMIFDIAFAPLLLTGPDLNRVDCAALGTETLRVGCQQQVELIAHLLLLLGGETQSNT